MQKMSLAITEKRPQQRPQQRPSSCVGIFFHLFSKKKLFSKKLLPPAKKTTAKKFAGDDQIPMGKLLLIADDNSSGYSISDPDPEPEPDTDGRMQEPCIVARLMGLDSMPVVPHEKPRKVMDSKFSKDISSDRDRHDHDLCGDNAESRPQKQQKTGAFVENAASNVFHRGIVAGFTKKQQVRLGLPVKSSRLLSRSNTVRLVQVANKILEPGLHSNSKTIMYRDSLDGEVVVVEPLNGSLAGSCDSCDANEHFVSEFECSALDSCDWPEEEKESKSLVVPSGQSNNGLVESNKSKSVGVLNGHVKNGSLAIQAKLNVESRILDLVERKQDEYSSKTSVKRNGTRQQKPLPTSRKEARRDLNQLRETKDFVALNKNLSNCARSRSPTKAFRPSQEIERNGWEKNMSGKKRLTGSSQIGSVRAASPNSGKEKCVQMDAVNRRQFVNSRSIGSRCDKIAIRKLDGDNLSGSKDSGIVSFTFNSPMRRDSSSFSSEGMVQRRRGQGEVGRDACDRNKLTSNRKFGSSSSAKVMALRGDELSSLLEEKIRELSALDHDGFACGDDLPGRSTASILQELISALTLGAPELENNGDSASDMSTQTDISISRSQISNVDKEFQEKDQPGNIIAYLSSETNQPSPVSILEAPFSNDTSSFDSPNDRSGGKSQFVLSDIYKKTSTPTPSLESETDLADTATSSTTSQSSGEKIHHTINKSSSIYGFGVSNNEVSEAATTISDAELLFETISANWSDGSVNSSLNTFLLTTLESIKDSSILSFNVKEANQFREFLLDCLMECLDPKLSIFWISGLGTWVKHSMILNRQQLTRDIHAEIRGWADLAGKYLDDLVEKDISKTNMSWTECKAETFDVVLMIQSDILQTLVDEMFFDL